VLGGRFSSVLNDVIIWIEQILSIYGFFIFFSSMKSTMIARTSRHTIMPTLFLDLLRTKQSPDVRGFVTHNFNLTYKPHWKAAWFGWPTLNASRKDRVKLSSLHGSGNRKLLQAIE
jgi:hypothetical protein